MINLISLVWGVVALFLALICMIQFLGWGNWGVIVLAIIGAIIGAFSSKKGGLYLNIIALLLAFFRLIFGGGII